MAQTENKPILLSVGYAACHWCHVMAHESFEDEETAAYMNQHFVNIKVDREERPDIDSIYMGAVQAMTGQGGWPMTVILTPEGRPFFGGTYYPPEPRMGLPSFRQVLVSVASAWEKRRDEIDDSARSLTEHLGRTLELSGGGALGEGVVEQALDGLKRSFDETRGGFGAAPKFPPSMTIEFLLHEYSRSGREDALQMAAQTLERMARGGMYDQLGGGFARYSTDANWLVPHFEKMLYDNALLSRAYLHAWQVTGNHLFRRIAEETLDFMAREMRHEVGGFYSSYDADSEGEEGKFYVWQPAEVRKVLGDEADLFMLYYDVSDRGNWEGKSILNVSREPEIVAGTAGLTVEELEQRLAAARRKLYDARARRVPPGLDDKILTSWNGLALAAFAEAGRQLGREEYLQIAVQNAEFLQGAVRTADGRLQRTWKAGRSAKYNAYLEDYAFLADGLLALYQGTFNERWFAWALELCQMMMRHFADGADGGFFDTSDDHEALIRRPKELQDNAIPSGNAMAAQALLKMSLYTGNSRFWSAAETAVKAMQPAMAKYPTAFAHWLGSLAFMLDSPREVAVVGEPGAADTQELLDAVFSSYSPNMVVAAGDGQGSLVPLLADREKRDGRATAYVCQRFVCQRPVTDRVELLAQLSQ